MNTQSKLWTYQFIAIVVMAFLFFLCLQLLTAGFPAYITDVKQNPTQGGLMTTVFMLAAILTRPFIGTLMQRVHIKWMSIISLVLLLITVGLSYNQDSVAVLLILRAIHGVGFGIISTILATMATTIIPVKRLGEGIGYYGLATSIGTTLAPMFALSILQYFSYNLLIVISVLFTLATLIMGLFIKAPQALSISSNRKGREKVPFKEYAYDNRALFPCLLTVFFTITLGGVISFLKELGEESGIGGAVSLFFLMMAIVMTVARPISGQLFDRLGHKVIIYPAIISGIVSFSHFSEYFFHTSSRILLWDCIWNGYPYPSSNCC
ncbi:MFS transporter [Bacillus sp. Marseille-P3661]|uniref:MFS transporter n=1 Tax=Bacillus sp. Marseille-P3661 TaxID=1936234 RepID=UPI002154F7FA|nr:MFS transporter [Bacillus sp. Marseille-P3661]